MGFHDLQRFDGEHFAPNRPRLLLHHVTGGERQHVRGRDHQPAQVAIGEDPGEASAAIDDARHPEPLVGHDMKYVVHRCLDADDRRRIA